MNEKVPEGNDCFLFRSGSRDLPRSTVKQRNYFIPGSQCYK